MPVQAAMDMENDIAVELRRKVLLAYFEDQVWPWFEKYKTVQSLLDEIDPHTERVRPPSLAGREFYLITVGHLPKDWPYRK
ncbi:MAG: hypothetical protein ACR2HJ_00380 [Fimbriimonadales bacterium]